MYADVEYISTTGKIPILPRTPFRFNDGVVLKTEKELQEMEFSTLLIYSSTLSTSISKHRSTLSQNSKIKALYSYLKQTSQSSINGLNHQINVDSANIAIYQDIARNEPDINIVWEYDGVEWTYDTPQYDGKQRGGGNKLYISTLDQFDSIIRGQTNHISKLNSTIKLYQTQYQSSMSSIELEYSTFDIKAKIYSTAVWKYKGYETLYANKQNELSTLNMELSNARTAEEKSSAILETKMAAWREKSAILNGLYDKRLIIGSNIARYRREESKTYIDYISSIAGFSNASSIYNAAILNEKYAIATSDLTGKIRLHSYALEQYNSAQLAWEESVQTGGARTAATGNSALKAALDMAKQQLDIKSLAKSIAQSNSSRLLDLATLANTEAYETLLSGYDSRIDAYKRTSSKFKGYKQSSLQEVVRFSSIYDQAVIDIAKYTGNVKEYSTLYESSINAASTLLGLSDTDFSTARGESNAYVAISLTIQGLTKEYTRLTQEYQISMSNSTMYASKYYNSLKEVKEYKFIYDSTNKVVTDLQTLLYGPGGLMSKYYTTLFMNSTILNDEIISQKVYDSQIMDLVNQQDAAMQQYRETIIRTKRIAYQQLYETNIYAAVLTAQSNGVTIANLETPDIRASRNQLTDINTFLLSFSNIYTMFDTQYSNATRISTSVGYESNAWSSLNSYTWKQYFNISPVDPRLIRESCAYLTLNQATTGGLLQTFAEQQSNINAKKVDIYSGLKPFFTDTEILAQDDKISSFILASESAVLQTIYHSPSSDLTWTDQ